MSSPAGTVETIGSGRADRTGPSPRGAAEHMAFDSPSLAAQVAPAGVSSSSPQPVSKYRIRFRKAGDLRLVSHHDLMHCFERMMRRAELPMVYTQGFNPHPRITFALSLALGVVGGAEVVDLDLAEALSAEEVRTRLARQAPPGLEVLSVTAVDAKAKLQVCRAFYRTAVPAERCGELPERIAALLGACTSWIERSRPQRRRLDVRPYISELTQDGNAIEMALWITPHGAARPEEVLQLLGLGDLFAAGEVILERTKLELMDEVPGLVLPALFQRGPQRPEPEEQTKDTGLSAAPEEKEVAAQAAPRPTSLIGNPLGFDS